MDIMEWFTEKQIIGNLADANETAARPGVVDRIDFVQTIKADRHDRNPEPDSHHADAGAKRLKFAVSRSQTLGKNNRAVSAINQIRRVCKRAPSARHLLR